MQTFEEVLSKHIRPIGRWQITIIIILQVSNFPFIFFSTLAHTPPPHRCHIPSLDNNSHLTYDQVRRLAIPDKPSSSPPTNQAYQACERYKLPFDHLSELNFSSALSRVDETKNENGTEGCKDGFVYDHKHALYRFTMGEEFDLVCEKAPMLTFVSSIYMPGMTAGLLVAGYTADWIGRRRALVIFGFYNLLVGLAIPFSPNIQVYTLLRFLLAMSGNAHGIVAYVLWMELVDEKYRTIVNILSQLYYAAFARGLFTLMAWQIQSWRTLAMAMTWCLWVAPLYLTPLVTESPRWLLSKGRTKEATALIKRCVTLNRGKKYAKEEEEANPDAFKCYSITESKSDTKHNPRFLVVKVKQLLRSFAVLFLTPKVRRRSLIGISLFCFQVVAFYAVSFYAIHVKGNAYVISFVEGLMALPACLVMYLLYQRFKRRGPMMSLHALSALVCLVSGLVIYMQGKGSITVVVLANVVIALEEAAFDMMYIHLPECFPTEIRNTALSTASALARIAGMSASYIEQLDSSVWPPLPMLVIGSLCACMIGLVYLLPETKGTHLADTVIELEMETVDFSGQGEQMIRLINDEDDEEDVVYRGQGEQMRRLINEEEKEEEQGEP